jgi:hypothetical protein
LCLAQTLITLYVTMMTGVQYPREGTVTPLFIVDFIISMFLITYASDMLSLWVSSLAHNTTAAMTIMPFVLIFQLVFSGGMLDLPAWADTVSDFTISNPGLKVIAAQADINNRPYASIANMVGKMRDSSVSGTFTVGQALDVLSEADLKEQYGGTEIGGNITLGEAADFLANSPDMQARRDQEITVQTTVGKVLDLVGEDRVKTYLEDQAAAVSYQEDYVRTRENVVGYWMNILLFILLFALLSTVTLEFIDKDKR